MLGFARELWSCFSVFLNETSRSSLLRPLTFDLARCFSLPSLSRTLALALSPSEENRRIWEGNDPGPPVVPGGQGIGLGSEPSRERVVIGVPRRRSGPPCVLPKGVPQGQTESGGIVLAAICWATRAQRRCHPHEALYFPTFSHLLFVNKLLSLSLSLSLSLVSM